MTYPNVLVAVRNSTVHRATDVDRIWKRLKEFAGQDRDSFLQLLLSVQEPSTRVSKAAAHAIGRRHFALGWDHVSGQLSMDDSVRSIVGSCIDHDNQPGGLIHPVREDPGPAQAPPAGRSFSWDWKGQPDFEEIAKACTELSARGQIFWTQVNDGTDACTWVVSNQELTEAEAEEAVEAGIYYPERNT